MRQLYIMVAIGFMFGFSMPAFSQEEGSKKEEATPGATESADKPAIEKDPNYKIANENWGRLMDALNEAASIMPENMPVILAYWAALADAGTVWNAEETKQLDEMGALYMLYWKYGERCLALLTDSGSTSEFLANLANHKYVAKVERYIATTKQLATVVLLQVNKLKTKLKPSPRTDKWEAEGDKRWAESAPLTEAEPKTEEKK